jgi:ATP-dependent phosphofructokinase / diphosphate-dependent phosphofructokinase
MVKGNAVIGQSGGPTSVINASLCGVVETAVNSSSIGKVYGMNFGIEGFMQEQLLDLSAQPENVIKGLKLTPSSALGSSRHKVKNEDLPLIRKVLEKYNVRYLFMIGGNDTMDTIHRIESYCRESGYELAGIGIPKTVENDLYNTDHTPGFASAAKYNILSVKQSGLLAKNMQKVDQFVIYQTIGRDAGWLAGSTALAGKEESDPPHLIYMPERSFDEDQCLKDVEKCIHDYGFCSIVCGEGIKYQDGTPVSSAHVKDKFNNIEFGAMGGASAALTIHRIIREKTGLRGEFQITESLIMCAMDRAVQSDIEEAFQCGREAVKLAESGTSGYMVAIERISNEPYRISYGKTPLHEVAVHAKPMPDNYFNEKGNYVSDTFIRDYMNPLIGRLPEYTGLEKIFARC